MGSTVELDLVRTNERLRGLEAQDRIRWAVDTFGPHAVLLSSMQRTASVLMHLFHRLGLENEILFADTGFHFRETLALRDEFVRRYRVNLVTLYPEMTPEAQERTFEKKLYLYLDGQKECCRLRKTVPFLDHMKRSGHRLTMVGLRRMEGGRRGQVEPLVPDPRIHGYTLHPIFDWTNEQVVDYLRENTVPEHPLHRRNYPSIGCECCTTPVAPDEHPRAGRWRHLREPGEDGPKYCNINFSDGAGI